MRPARLRAPCAKRGRRAGSSTPGSAAARNVDHVASYPNAPSTTITRTFASSSSSRTRYGKHVSRFERCGLVGRRRTANRGRDVRVVELQTVADTDRFGLVGEAGAVQRREQEVARAVAGEDPTGAVAAVGGRARARRAASRASGSPKPGTGRPQYVLVPERGALSRAPLAPATRRGAGSVGTRRSRRSARRRSRAGTACEPTAGAQLTLRGARAAPRQRDRVVGDGTQARDDPQAARRATRRRGGGNVPPRSRDASRARGRERRLRRRRGARGRRHAERSRRRTVAHRHRARAAARRVDERLRAHARLSERRDRRRARS